MCVLGFGGWFVRSEVRLLSAMYQVYKYFSSGEVSNFGFVFFCLISIKCSIKYVIFVKLTLLFLFFLID